MGYVNDLDPRVQMVADQDQKDDDAGRDRDRALCYQAETTTADFCQRRARYL